MPLASIIGRSIELNTVGGVTDQEDARAAALDMLQFDTGAVKEAIVIAVTKLIHDNATRGMRAIGRPNDPRPRSLFGLRARDATDEHFAVIKDTELLPEMEFDRIISIREQQLLADTRHLDALRSARTELKPIWREYPDKLFGEVERIYLAGLQAG